MSLLAAEEPAHPWLRAVIPADLTSGRLCVVKHGALASGTRGHAIVDINQIETRRRMHSGIAAVTSLPLLDVLMNLPLGSTIRTADLSDREMRTLTGAPPGCVEIGHGTVRRVVSVPLTVVAVLVAGTGWRSATRRAAAFTPFAQRIVLMRRPPDEFLLWEAQLADVGIWIDRGDHGPRAVLDPVRFVQRYHQPAGWRFAERVFGAFASSQAGGGVPGDAGWA